MKKKRKHKKNNNKINKIFLGANILISLILLIMITILNVVPFKYLIIIYAIALLFNVVLTYFLLKKNNKISYTISTIFIIVSIIAIFFLNSTNNFLSYFNKDNYKTENFLVLVLKDSYYNKLEDLSDKNIGYVNNEITSINKAIEKINNKINISNLEFENYNLIFDKMLNKELSSTLIEESNYNLILEENETYNDKFRILEEIKITTKINNKNSNVDVTKDTFNILISGIDTYGEISSVGRSDVNMIITVNPKTKQILMTSIPRDYYVRLYNTTGYKDKLTHSGLYGIEMTVNTIEDLLAMDINYYFRVNFSTLEKVIDAIGGVDVYSEYSFVSYIGNYQFYKGYNHMNGEQALGFARERKTLPNGDINRAENQQAVIDGIIRKLTSVSTITKYNSILNSLEDTFQTNMTEKDITSLLKMQLSDNARWNITSNVLIGTGASEYTYSYSYQKLYVMIPSDESVNEGINLIDKVYSDNLLESSYDDSASNVKNPNKVYNDNNNNNNSSNNVDNKNENTTKNEDDNQNEVTDSDNDIDDNNTSDTPSNNENEKIDNDKTTNDNENNQNNDKQDDIIDNEGDNTSTDSNINNDNNDNNDIENNKENTSE